MQVNTSNQILAQLERRDASGTPIRVAVVGTGEYGASLVCQLAQIKGIQPTVVCDLSLERAGEVYALAGYRRDEVAHAEELTQLERRALDNQPSITDDFQLALRAPVDAVVDCTGQPEVGCRIAQGAIRQGKHAVMVNAEADVTAGAQLAEQARKAGVVYTLADGDQPSLITGLVDWARCLGLEVVTAGKWTKVYPPEIAQKKLAKLSKPTKSDITYLDGTKTQIEMACAANATGLSIDTPGMHGHALDLRELPTKLRAASCGGSLKQGGVVDFVNCVTLDRDGERYFSGGIFIVVTTESQLGLQAMKNKNIIMSHDGAHALLYRPYHLVGIETPWSILKAVLAGIPTAAPSPEPEVEVVAVANYHLTKGTVLGGLGTADVHGVAVRANEAAARRELPIGLAAGTHMKVNAPLGTHLSYDMVEAPADSLTWSLRRPPQHSRQGG